MKTLIIVAGVILFAGHGVRAQLPAADGPGTGLGVIVGDATGVSLKHWTSERTAVDLAVAWSLSGRDEFHLHADYLWHDFETLKAEQGRTAWYYGLGARFVAREDEGWHDHRDDDSVGVRVPVGLDYFFADNRLEAFLELAPVLELAPDTDLEFDLGLGLRFYFR